MEAILRTKTTPGMLVATNHQMQAIPVMEMEPITVAGVVIMDIPKMGIAVW